MRTIEAVIEAERAVLGSMLLDRESCLTAAQALKANDFTSPENAAIFQAISGLVVEGKPVDHIGVMNASGGEIGIRTLAALTDGVFSASNVQHYIDIVAESALRRRIANAGKRIHEAAEETDDVQELQASAVAALMGISAKDTVPVSGTDVGAEFLAHLEKSRTEGDKKRCRYGFRTLDAYTGGMCGGEMIIIAARPATGKTGFGLQVTLNNLAYGKRVGFFSLEMTARSIMQRIASNVTGIRGEKFRNPRNLLEDDYRRMDDFYKVCNDNLQIVTRERSAEAIRLYVMKQRLVNPLDMIIVDYLGLLETTGRHYENRAVEVAKISRSLKLLAMELDIPVIAMSQINRENEKDKRQPRLIDLRESGAIEQDADTVLLMHNPAAGNYEAEKADPTEIEVIVGKNRHGQADLQIPFLYYKATQRFKLKFDKEN